MAWYEESFGRDYLKLYAHRDLAEARANVRAAVDTLSLAKEEPLLDLCCGAGRHLLVLREMGFQDLVGLDLSDELLQVTRQRLVESNTKSPSSVALVRADMRSIPYQNHFAGILSFFTSFGYFEADEDNQAVLTAAHRALRPGGVFLLDYLNQERVIANLVPRDEKNIPAGHVKNVRCLTEDCRRVEKTTTVTTEEGQSRFHESVRLYSSPEMAARFQKANFTNIRCYGALDGEKFTPQSERLILAGEKGNRM
ncbi:MAG: dTDP-3-amino-3,4,6-trideoxy-alpha-D-glucopyranose [Chloroflexi bacterium]|nr:dTDP-3-amino-3,4,6-trideoxy-alpha-D-glucopyranose [Chloroflexota bacterium]